MPIPIRVMRRRSSVSNVPTRWASFHAAAVPSFSLVSTKRGMKAEERAPSPKRRRKRLGRVKATKKADASKLVPR